MAGYEDIGFAKLDISRENRRGFSEAIFCECKTPEQLVLIYKTFKNKGQNILGTRATKVHAEAVIKPSVLTNELNKFAAEALPSKFEAEKSLAGL